MRPIKELFARLLWRVEVWADAREWRRAWRTPLRAQGITPTMAVCANCAHCVPKKGGKACLFTDFPAMPGDPACATFHFSNAAKNAWR